MAIVLKQLSEWCPEWALVIRLGQDLILQANGYCIRSSETVFNTNPLARGLLCSVEPNGIRVMTSYKLLKRYFEGLRIRTGYFVPEGTASVKTR